MRRWLTAPRRWVSALHRRWTALPLRTRLVTIMTSLLLVALTVAALGSLLLMRGIMINQIDQQLLSVAETAQKDKSVLSALTGGAKGDDFPTQYVVKLSVDGQESGAASVAGGGWRSTRNLPTFPDVTQVKAFQERGTTYTVRASDGSSWRATSLPVTVYDDPGAMTIMLSTDDVRHAALRLGALMFATSAVVLTVLAAGGLYAIRRAFRPLTQVEHTAAAIAGGDLSQRVPEYPSNTEMGRLSTSLNGMLTRIEEAFRDREASEERTRRFAADASHELRTPLASVRGYAELYRQGAVPDAEVPRTMRRIEDEATRMGRLVEDLLMLARLDAQRPTRAEPVDLLVLAADAVDDARALAPGRDVRLVGLGQASGPSPAPVLGDEDRLRQVVANLVGNAVRHTPAGSAIEVAVGTADGEAVLQVIDHGQGLTPEQAERVFERFYRTDPSRQRGEGGGSGLGLSIVDAVVRSHFGTASVATTPGGGATFQVRVPLAGHGPGAELADTGDATGDMTGDLTGDDSSGAGPAPDDPAARAPSGQP